MPAPPPPVLAAPSSFLRPQTFLYLPYLYLPYTCTTYAPFLRPQTYHLSRELGVPVQAMERPDFLAEVLRQEVSRQQQQQ